MDNDCNTVQLYHEFLNYMEATDYSNNQVHLDSYSCIETSSDTNYTKTRRTRLSNSYPPSFMNIKVQQSLHQDQVDDVHQADDDEIEENKRFSLLFQHKHDDKTNLPLHNITNISLSNLSSSINNSITNISNVAGYSDSLEVQKSHSNEFVNLQDFNIALDLDDNFNYMDDSVTILSYDDDEDNDDLINEFHNMNDPGDNHGTYNHNNINNNTNTNDSNDNESNNDINHNNPMAPGLFPKFDINDDKFLKFDKLPLNPSYIAH